MGKVVYIFGAGASFGCLPLVEGVGSALEEFEQFLIKKNEVNDIQGNFVGKSGEIYQSSRGIIGEILLDLQDLIKNTKEHATIDTYAKKLFVRFEMEKYQSLKTLLAYSFLYRQITSKPDPRYDPFFAAITQPGPQFIGDINIISWNYDIQFEVGFHSYFPEDSLVRIQSFLNVWSDGDRPNLNRNFSIYKINGSTAFKDDYSILNVHDDLRSKDPSSLFNSIISRYGESITKNGSKISFSWQTKSNPESGRIINELYSDTQAIIVIGYSFPFFNRDRDKQLLQSMVRCNMVYIQDPNFESVKISMESLIGVHPPRTYLNVTDPKKFYLPAEL